MLCLSGEGLPFADLCGKERTRCQGIAVPTLFRFLFVVAVLAGLGFAGLFALATFVEPQPREMSTPIPPNRLGR